MKFFTGVEYEYARSLVFFGFVCGVTFSYLVAVLSSLFAGRKNDRENSAT